MRQRSRGFDWQRILRSRLTLLFGALLVAALFTAVGREIARRYEVNREIASLQQHIEELEAKETGLTKLIEYFGSPLFREQEAREKLGLAKAGETVLIVPLEGQSPIVTEGKQISDQTSSPDPRSYPQRWWDFFFPPS